ncbi:hypothetical protein BDZ89DRAFT_1129396 [Hymenopellis radicata]|nr:hypothetical protein BDZ89DRAFT_1129396 [Hymenopellis radicata]
MSMLDSHSPRGEKVVFPLIGSLGLGCLFQIPVVALQAAMPLKDTATSTSAFGFIRTLGGTIGISVGQVVFSSTLTRRVDDIPGAAAALSDDEYHYSLTSSSVSRDYDESSTTERLAYPAGIDAWPARLRMLLFFDAPFLSVPLPYTLRYPEMSNQPPPNDYLAFWESKPDRRGRQRCSPRALSAYANEVYSYLCGTSDYQYAAALL